MENRHKELEEKFPDLKFELKNYNSDEPEEDPEFYIETSGFKGSEELILTIENEDDYDTLDKVLEESFSFITNYFGVQYQDKIEIALLPVNIRTNNLTRIRLKNKPAKIEMNFYKNQLEIEIRHTPPDSLLENIKELMIGRKSLSIMTIKGYIKPTHEGKDIDIFNILNTVLFDFGYNYNIVFEPINFDSFNRRIPTRRRNRMLIPDEKINVIYKKYIPELIEYFNIGEKVDYLPFRFICYFHIIEYFSDKSAYFHASKRLKSLMLKPDFHLNTDKYVNQAINFFKIEATKNTSDKIKIRRVIGQFINKEDFREYLKETEAIAYFEKSCTISCSKPLELSPIDFESDAKFEESLMKRIYSMRCSIVHSNPDFDESKAIPFSPTVENMEKLRKEIEMIYEVARIIIIESSHN